MASSFDSLKVRLRRYTKCCLALDAEFLPRDTLQELITQETVASILETRDDPLAENPQQHTYSSDLSLVNLVTEEAKVIFAILIILDHEYLNCNSCDGESKIPFVSWSEPDLMDFVRIQWPFLAPVLKANGETIRLQDKCPLPFIDDGDEDPARGGGGWVFRARVHPAHQEGFEDVTNDLRVAVKEFHRRELFEQENRILIRIKNLRHAHIIRHLSSIEVGKKRAYSIFPWTGSGTLHDFWLKPAPQLNNQHVLWAFQQMHGLVSAIHTLHEIFNCRHGDLKPQNILCFEENGETVFKVADFGISKIHDMPTINRKVATTNFAYTASYQGPEIEFEKQSANDQQPRSRKYDIWSLGCVFLEFFVWLLHGPESMAEFGAARETSGSSLYGSSLYEITDKVKKQAKVHRLADGTVEALTDDPRCSGETGLAELLSIIRGSMLKTKVNDRASAEDIATMLSGILARHEEGVLRLFNPCMESDIRRLQFDGNGPS
ncbi:hypothetical protein G7054_g6356 [Neopestalotiopsis clavispora]|nr:hypothetical protein G7054_g6356 [Neopestalotiopsis clavispora]